MSPHHVTFGAGAVKSRLSRSPNFGAVSPCLVNPLRRLGLRPAKPLALHRVGDGVHTHGPAGLEQVAVKIRGEP